MPPERVISISISESDWKALRNIQPEPVDWLKGQIRDTIERARQDTAPQAIVRPAVAKVSGGR